MAQTTATGRVQQRARSRERQALIMKAARDMFTQLGYDQVGMNDIAAEVGLTGGALYRHFRGKRELLARIVFEGLAEIEVVMDHRRVAAEGSAERALDALLRGLAWVALEIRYYPVLWQREPRHLSVEERSEFTSRLLALSREGGITLGAVRTDLSPGDVDFLAWAVLMSMLASPAYHTVNLPRARFEEILYQMATVACATAVLPGVAPSPSPSGTGNGRGAVRIAARASRREVLLSAAISLFARQGYAATTMEDIGGAAGISGPSVYEHFPSKIDLLVTATTRAVERLEAALSQALARASDPTEALHAVVDSYVTQLLDQTDLFSTLITEIVHVPDAERHLLRRIQHDYHSEWVQLLRDIRSDLTEAEGRVIIHAVLSLFNDVARTRRFRQRPNLHAELVQIGMELLTTPTV